MKKAVLVDDLAPYFNDPCWMWVLLAREASTAVILRRGPTQWWHVVEWDTRRDSFVKGQWFRGRLYPGKCDVSPNGKLLVYFGGKFRAYKSGGYGDTWTAVSRPPYLTALALWPVGGTYGGGGVFLDNRTVTFRCSAPLYEGRHHPDHPPGPLRIVEPWKAAEPVSRRTHGDMILECETMQPSRRKRMFTLNRADGSPSDQFEAHWADFDQLGRIVATVGGRVLAASRKFGEPLRWQVLADFHEERPQRMEAPEWAQRWMLSD